MQTVKCCELEFFLTQYAIFSALSVPSRFSRDQVTGEFICADCLYSQPPTLTEQPQTPPHHSPVHHTVGMALGHRAGTQGSSGQLHRVLHRCPRQHPALAEHCPAADCHRVYSKEQRQRWRLRPHLTLIVGQFHSKWHWNLQTPETTKTRKESLEVKDPDTPSTGSSQRRVPRKLGTFVPSF